MSKAFWRGRGRTAAGRRSERRRNPNIGEGLPGPERLEERCLLATGVVVNVSTFAGTAGKSGSANGSGALARFNNAAGVAIDPTGNVYVADQGNFTIREISLDGFVTTFAGVTGQGGTADGGPTTAKFEDPLGVAADAAGNVYVTDGFSNTIRKITSQGVVSTFAGTAGPGGSADGTGASAQFQDPNQLAFDPAGNLYVSDSINATIRKITPAGVVSTFAGSPDQTGSADGTGPAARFKFPSGIAVDSAGNVYVADSQNDTIRKITPDRVVTTFAGTAGKSGSTDGTGTAALFNAPVGLSIDAAGNLYVADAGNATIREISPAGVVTTLAGSPGKAGSADGAGPAAQFKNPLEIVVAPGGNVAYVSDNENSTIRKLVIGSPLPIVSVIGADNQVYTQPTDEVGNPVGVFSRPQYGGVKSLAAIRFESPSSGPIMESFVIGADNQVYATTLIGGFTSGYFPIASGSVSSISVGLSTDGFPLLFAVGTDSQLYEARMGSTGHPLTGYSKPAFGSFKQTVVTSDAINNPIVFAIGTDNQVYGLQINAVGSPQGGVFKVGYGGVNALAVGHDSARNPEVFVIGTDNGVYAHKFDSSDNPAGNYFSVGGTARALSLTSDASGNPALFVIGTDNQVYYQDFGLSGKPVGTYVGAGSVAGGVSMIVAGNGVNGSPEVWALTTATGQVYAAPFDASGNLNSPLANIAGTLLPTTPGKAKALVIA